MTAVAQQSQRAGTDVTGLPNFELRVPIRSSAIARLDQTTFTCSLAP